MKVGTNYNLSVVFLKEKKRFVAHSPALDLSTSGRSFSEAKRRFEQAASIFFEEIINKGTLDEILEGLGWEKQKKIWQPPIVISQNVETVSVPVTA